MMKLRANIAVFSVFLALLAGAAHAQQYFKKWTTENGLPQINIINIAQTPEGYLWVATVDGLARFDGVRFKIFNKSNTPEMPNNRIFAMFTDTAGRLWFNYLGDQTVVVYENGKFNAFEKGRDFEKDENIDPNVRYNQEYNRHLLRNPEMRFRKGETEYVYEGGHFITRPATEERSFPSRVFATDSNSIWIDEADAIYHIEGEKVTRHGKDEPLPVIPKQTFPVDSLSGSLRVLFGPTDCSLLRMEKLRHFQKLSECKILNSMRKAISGFQLLIKGMSKLMPRRLRGMIR